MNVEAQKGSCLCGGIVYEIRAPLRDVVNCHCTMCRKAHGAAFRTRASVRVEDFRFITGEDLERHVFTKYKAPWHEITDTLPQVEDISEEQLRAWKMQEGIRGFGSRGTPSPPRGEGRGEGLRRPHVPSN